MLELHIIQPDRQIIKAQLQDGLYYAGSSDCQLLLKFPGVSRRHLEMRVKNNILYIKDLANLKSYSCFLIGSCEVLEILYD